MEESFILWSSDLLCNRFWAESRALWPQIVSGFFCRVVKKRFHEWLVTAPRTWSLYQPLYPIALDCASTILYISFILLAETTKSHTDNMSLFSVDAVAGQSVCWQTKSSNTFWIFRQASLSDFSKINGLVLQKIAIVPVIQMVEAIRLIPKHIEIAYFQSDAQGYDLRVNRHNAMSQHLRHSISWHYDQRLSSQQGT